MFIFQQKTLYLSNFEVLKALYLIKHTIRAKKYKDL